MVVGDVHLLAKPRGRSPLLRQLLLPQRGCPRQRHRAAESAACVRASLHRMRMKAQTTRARCRCEWATLEPQPLTWYSPASMYWKSSWGGIGGNSSNSAATTKLNTTAVQGLTIARCRARHRTVAVSHIDTPYMYV